MIRYSNAISHPTPTRRSTWCTIRRYAGELALLAAAGMAITIAVVVWGWM